MYIQSRASRPLCALCLNAGKVLSRQSRPRYLITAFISSVQRSSIHHSTKSRSADISNPASVLQSLDTETSSRLSSGTLQQVVENRSRGLDQAKIDVNKAVAECERITNLGKAVTPAQLLAGISAAEKAAQTISGRDSLIFPDPITSRSSQSEDPKDERIAHTSFSRQLASAKIQTSARLSRLPTQLRPEISRLSEATYNLVQANTDALTQDSLRKYTNIHCLLQTPEMLPEIFDIFSDMSKASAIQRVMNPICVDASTGFSALDSAIKLKNAALAIAIIDSTIGHSSFRRVKFIKQALPPLTLALITPAVLFPAVNKIAAAQSNLPTETASGILFAGVMTYLGVVGSMGYMTVTSTITTANRQVEGANSRVSWAPGLALWKRWLGEHERLGMDKVVSAWGFADDRHWGGEEGQEWQELKEVAALKGMQVDAQM